MLDNPAVIYYDISENFNGSTLSIYEQNCENFNIRLNTKVQRVKNIFGGKPINCSLNCSDLLA